jgi:hypothetical protein
LQDTFGGFVQQTQPNSQPVTEGTIKRIQQQAREIALSEFDVIREYLNDNYTLFPLWIPSISTKPFTPKFTSISKTAYNDSGDYGICETTGKRIIQ